jgi:hypothetical protein
MAPIGFLVPGQPIPHATMNEQLLDKAIKGSSACCGGELRAPRELARIRKHPFRERGGGLVMCCSSAGSLSDKKAARREPGGS